MNGRVAGLPWVALAVGLGLAQAAGAAMVTTPQIVARTAAAAPACLQWTPVGLCFWLSCSWTGCKVRSSLKVGHHNPDLVVSVYNELGANPWAEVGATLGLAQKAAAEGLLGALLPVPLGSAGNRSEGSPRGRDHRNLVFREADAVGHPTGALGDLAAGVGLLCQSQTTPLFPYFQSGLDALAWRQEVPEALYPASWVPGLREVGSWPLNTWGSVFPRTGWTTQADEPKAAAVTAQRVGDIVTRAAQPHVYVPLSGASYMHNDVITRVDDWTWLWDDDGGSLVNRWFPVFSGQKVWPPGPLKETDRRTGTWQMLTPRAEGSCAVFGTNDLASVSGWGGGRVDPGGDYAWTLWRPYTCCKRSGQWFLFDLDWTPYPP